MILFLKFREPFTQAAPAPLSKKVKAEFINQSEATLKENANGI